MPLTVKCPTCRVDTAWENNPHRPFCSKRCQVIDLGAWVEERYKIPGDEWMPDEEDEDNAKKS